MQPGCQLRTTSEQCCFTYHTWGITIANINCPLGPYVPAAMMCLSAVQAPCLTKLHHTTPSTPQQAAQYSNNTLCNITLCTIPLTDVMPTLHKCYTRVMWIVTFRVMQTHNRPYHVSGA